MTIPQKITIIREEVPQNAPEDLLDVLTQVNSVAKACDSLGYKVITLPVTSDHRLMLDKIASYETDVVFNLVESIDGNNNLLYLAPAVLEQNGIPFTGSSSQSIRITTDKLLTKEILYKNGINTPLWQTIESVIADGRIISLPVIFKPVSEDGSCGIDDSCVCHSDNDIQRKMCSISKGQHSHWFIEEYIQGREFNVGLLANDHGVEVLPVAEMKFMDFPKDKPQILNYASKWAENAFEYGHTVRNFDIELEDRQLLDNLAKISLFCWRILDLAGYVRVDFRVNSVGIPMVLEVNANPCISPDSGFTASVIKAGLTYPAMIQRILKDALRKKRKVADANSITIATH